MTSKSHPLTPEEKDRRYRDDLLDELAGLASDKPRAEQLVRYIRDTNLDIEEKQRRNLHSKQTEAGDAVIEYLTIRGYAMTRDELAQALVASGWVGPRGFRDSDATKIGRIKKAISQWINGFRNTEPKLKEINGKIGLTGWDTEMFS